MVPIANSSLIEDVDVSEIEVTPEMVDAGLWELDEAKAPLADDVLCVKAIFRAMLRASREAS